ncbi:MAG TPA: chemotaxis protein CheB [Chitinophagaceae bacterium]|nr:chemotaxis protein CheB [Chitinophagaceae bacterium]
MAQDAVSTYKTIVIGGSAGSLDSMLRIIAGLPASKKFIVIVVLHRKNDTDSILTDLIRARTRLAVREVEDKEAIVPGTVYLAPPDYHLLIENEQLFSLDTSERVHFSRPSIDVTFESVAETFGERAIGILLSGANADGAAGLEKIKHLGGFTIVQDPASAEVGFMPQQAINRGAPNQVLLADQIAAVVNNLLR